MPTSTYTPLATATLGSPAISVTFSAIPATYRDLVLVTNGKIQSGGEVFSLYFNGDTTSSNYSFVQIANNNTTPESASGNRSQGGAIYPGDGSFIHNIMDYSATDKHKTFLGTSRTVSVNVIQTAVRWANTAAITSVEFRLDGNLLVAGSTLSLYGIAS